MRLAPVIAASDPLPAEMLAAADTLAHQAGDMMIHSSALSLMMRRADAQLDVIERANAALAESARAAERSIETIAARIAALQAAGR